ncbi:MAG: butyrate kinase [Bacteroidales bacterium]|jgi:butyrate kinase|nr:butyrate kinase [Bacteroidales bacterium]
MGKRNLILAINPGSTSTKIAIYEDNTPLFTKNIKHSANELNQFAKITDQYGFRKNLILEEVGNAGFDINEIRIVIGRGGLLKPIKSGVWMVNAAMLDDLQASRYGQHASNLGAIIAHNIASSIEGAEAIIADPVVVDELSDMARISGHPLMPRKSIFHALNQKAIARRYAAECGKKYEDLNLIVVHLGGGISIGAHEKGLVTDVNQALDGDGPFSPERTGSLPVNEVINICFSGKYSENEIRKMVCGAGGYVAYLGTNDALVVETKAQEGDKESAFLQSAMVYQVAKSVGAAATVLKGDIDAILVTGGIAYSKPFTAELTERIAFLAPVKIYPGEDEMGALAQNAAMYLKGEAKAKEYK